MMLTMSETATQDGLPLDMRSALVQGQYHGAAKDSPLYHHQHTEAEYREATMAAQENAWLMQLMKIFTNHLINCPTILHCDNQCTLCLAENLVFPARTKHVGST